MQAIVTKYLGPTNHRGARIVATADAGRHVRTYSYAVRDGEPQHRIAAEELRDILGWQGRLIGGYLPDGRYAFVFADCE